MPEKKDGYSAEDIAEAVAVARLCIKAATFAMPWLLRDMAGMQPDEAADFMKEWGL